MQFQQLGFTHHSTIEYWNTLYDQRDFAGYCYRERMKTVLAWLDDLDLPRTSRILDAGCGAGRLVLEASQRGYEVFGMDYSYGMAVKAGTICRSADGLHVAFLQGDVEALPLEASSCDVVVCLGVVAYLRNEQSALNSLARVLKPGGILAISIVNRARLAHRLDLPLLFVTIVRKILDSWPTLSGREDTAKNGSRVRTYSIPRFQKSLEAAGFGVQEYRTVPLELLTLGGKEVFPQALARRITLFFERFSHIPVVGSFGGMCIFKAQKNSPRQSECHD